MSKLFSDSKFYHFYLQEISKEIKEETEKVEHNKLGMFVLVLMSHGAEGDVILDCDCQPVRLVEIRKLLSPSHFPAMKGKPKLVIVQACSGSKRL